MKNTQRSYTEDLWSICKTRNVHIYRRSVNRMKKRSCTEDMNMHEKFWLFFPQNFKRCHSNTNTSFNTDLELFARTCCIRYSSCTSKSSVFPSAVGLCDVTTIVTSLEQRTMTMTAMTRAMVVIMAAPANHMMMVLVRSSASVFPTWLAGIASSEKQTIKRESRSQN